MLRTMWNRWKRYNELMMHRRLWTLATLGIVAIALVTSLGCASMTQTPVYERPEVPITKRDWSVELAQERRIDLKWWQAFGDPLLDELMERAIEQNLDLQVLAARMEVAGASIESARARLLPVFNAGTRVDSRDISGATDLGTSNKLGTGSEMVWELDVWGKARKGVAASKASLAASEAEWRAGYLVMAGAVADAYFQVRQSDQQISRQQAAIDAAKQILDVQRDMHKRGMIPRTELSQQEAELNSLRAQKLELERVRALSVNALATVTGVAAGDFQIPSTLEYPELQVVAVPAGLPSDMLSRRPDLVAAEYRLLQAVELEGQARLARLPTIGLTGLGGSASYGLSNLLQTWTAGLSNVVQFPVFDPNIRARLRVSEAQVAVAEAEYRVAVMRAFEEVENVLINLQSRMRQRQELTARERRLQSVQEQLDAQLRMGLISQLELLEQQRSLLAAEQAVLANRWQLLVDNVSLFKAVGGGWEEDIVAQGSR